MRMKDPVQLNQNLKEVNKPWIDVHSTVKLGFKEWLNKEQLGNSEQIGISEQFVMTKKFLIAKFDCISISIF